MDDLNDRISALLGESAVRRRLADDRRYHLAFVNSGVRKAYDILATLRERDVKLERLAYLSIGGSTGSEVLEALASSQIRYGILLEFDDDAADIARNRAQELGDKHLRVLCGDATAKITACRHILQGWKDSGQIDGLVCSIQAVLHELPTRSPGYSMGHLLGEALWTWDPCYFFCREPCAPSQWPERVRLEIRGVASERAEALAQHIKGQLRFEGRIQRSGPSALLLPADLAVELLFKLFYVEDYAHEIEERITSIKPDQLLRQVRIALKGGKAARRLLNSESFERLYTDFEVMAYDENTGELLEPPLVFVQIEGYRETRVSPQPPRPISGRSGALTIQADRILNTPLLPWSAKGSPSLRALWPELLVDPMLIPHRSPAPAARLTDWYLALRSHGHVAVVGSPGSGKSTALRRLFLDAWQVREEANAPFPVFGHVLDYVPSGVENSTSIKAARSSRRAVIHFIDGLDEADSTVLNTFFEGFVERLPPDEYAWAACRSELFFNRVSSDPARSVLFREVLELQPWQHNEVLKFVEQYQDRVGCQRLTSNFSELIRSNPEVGIFVRNPFHLTLLLYLLQHSTMEVDGIRNSFELYDQFYSHWVRRETFRGTARGDAASARSIHTMLAEALFDARGRLGDRGVEINDQIRVLLDDDSALADILKIDPDSGRVVGFRHETIGEYLLANKVLDTLFNPQSRLETVLLRTFTFETNRFVRQALELLTDSEREELVRLLSVRYEEYLSGAGSIGRLTLEDQVREQLLYYIGRIPSSSCPSVLINAYYRETHSVIKRIAALGAILHRDEEIEASYLECLAAGSPEDFENRSIQLVYFGDTNADFFTFTDDGRHPWERTKSAILERLASREAREESLRWWDLRTLRLFLISRGARLNDAELAVALGAFAALQRSSEGRVARIQQECEEIARLHDLGPVDDGG